MDLKYNLLQCLVGKNVHTGLEGQQHRPENAKADRTDLDQPLCCIAILCVAEEKQDSGLCVSYNGNPNFDTVGNNNGNTLGNYQQRWVEQPKTVLK